MARPPKIDEAWMPQAAELMVRQSLSLLQAVTELGVAITTAECENVLRRKSFQQLLWGARHKYSHEVAKDPARSKTSTIGQLQILAQKLFELGDYDKAAEVLFKLSRLEGWIGEGGVVNVFANLTQRDIDEMRAKLAAEGNESGLSVRGTEKTRPN